MKIPKIIFVYSGIYNALWKCWTEKSGSMEFNFIPSDKVLNYLRNYKNNIEKTWKKYEKKILYEISKTTRLKWRMKYINCYLVEKCFININSPLTLSVNKTYSDFEDILIHELIHTILYISGNFELTKNAWNYINKKYKNESKNIRLHIPLLAIHTHIFLKFFGEDRLNRHIGLSRYKRAWQIVQQEGYQNIIREFRSRIK